MNYVEVISFGLAAITLAVTLPTDSPHLYTLERTLDYQIYPGTPEIQFKNVKIETHVRAKDLLLQPLAESEEEKSTNYKLETNKERRRIWKVVTLSPKHHFRKTSKDLTSKVNNGKILQSAPAMAVPGRREPPPPTGYSDGILLARSTKGDALVSSSSPAGVSPNGISGKRTEGADVADPRRASGSDGDAATSRDHSGNGNGDLDFFWSWEAILLVALPSAWVVLVAALCLLTRSTPGKSLLQKLCPSPDPEDDAHPGHGIGFFDGSPGMRRRMTQCEENPATADVGMRATEREEEEEEEKKREGRNGEFRGEEIAPPVDDGWTRVHAGFGPLDDYQRVLRRLSLIQEEVSP